MSRSLRSAAVDARYVLWATTLAAIAILGAGTWTDWHYYRAGSSLLFSSNGLHLYAHAPDVQIGPLSLVIARALTALAGAHAAVVAQVVFTAGMLGVAWLVGRVANGNRPTLMLLDGLVLAALWPQMSMHVQYADCLVIAGLAGVVLAVGAGRGLVAGLLFGLSAAAKPWSLPAVPVLLGLPARERRRGLVAAATIVVACYLPFVISDRSTFDAGRATLPVARDTFLGLLHIAPAPGWVRPVQAITGLLLALVVVRRGRWQAAILAAVVARLALDPGDLPYYAALLVAAAWIWDVAGDQAPVASALAFGYVLIGGGDPTAVEVARLAVLCAMAGWLVLAPTPLRRATLSSRSDACLVPARAGCLP
jgi:hypothetical protein